MRSYVEAISNNKLPDIDYIRRFAETFGLVTKISREQILVIDKNGVVFITTVRRNPGGAVGYFSHELGPIDIDLTPVISQPPERAEKFLSLMLPPTRIEEAIGDFEEGYLVMLDRHGIGHARRWYWIQVIKVAARGLFDAACKAAKIIWGGFGPA
jgi:hypothetical protein